MSTAEEQIAAEMTPDKDEQGEEAEQEETPADPGEGTDAPEEAAPPPRSQKEIDELTKKLEAEAQRHAKRVAELMGDDFSLLVPSPVDWTPGFLFNVPEMLPSQEALDALNAILGHTMPQQMKEASDAEACDDCAALGEVLTGSRKPGQLTKPCAACGGTGWKPKLYVPTPQPSPVAQLPSAASTPPAPNQPIIFDAWQRPPGHIHYGIPPAQITA